MDWNLPRELALPQRTELRATAGMVENDHRTARPSKGEGFRLRQSVANATEFPQ